MSDLISRQAALALAKDIHVPTEDGAVYQHRCIDPEDIKELPSAQPEQKKGEWIPIYHGNKAMFYQCPYCGARYMLQTRFCGNCRRVVYHE